MTTITNGELVTPVVDWQSWCVLSAFGEFEGTISMSQPGKFDDNRYATKTK